MKESPPPPSGLLEKKTVDRVEANIGKCFLCLWILRDIEKYGKLAGGPEDFAGAKTFPVTSQLKHLEVEGFLRDGRAV